MKRERFKTEDVERLLQKRTIATMDELKKALKTDVDVTVFRKLKQLDYLTSYSHRGRYYSLKKLASFDEDGLWLLGSVCFSVYGTLVATAERFVKQAGAGYYSNELERILRVGVKETLLRLYRKGSVSRERISNRYLYCSAVQFERRQQLLSRQAMESEPEHGRLPLGEIHDELKAAIILFFCMLDEQQRRLFAGLESLKWGHGGDTKVAALLGLDVSTVAKGRRQLLTQEFDSDRIRKAGGGRQRVEKKRRRSSRRSKS